MRGIITSGVGLTLGSAAVLVHVLVDERGKVVGVVSAKVLAHGHRARAALAVRPFPGQSVRALTEMM